MAQKFRKKLQRRVNNLVRACNKNIEQDDLWKGRFCARQLYSQYQWYEDNSGAMLVVVLDFFDKKSKKHMTKAICMSGANCNDENAEFWNRHVSYDIFRTMNDFIVDWVEAWSDEVSPRDDKTDYTNIPYERLLEA